MAREERVQRPSSKESQQGWETELLKSGWNLGYTVGDRREVKTDRHTVPSWEEPRKECLVPPPGQQEVAETPEIEQRHGQMCVSGISSHGLCAQRTDRADRCERWQEAAVRRPWGQRWRLGLQTGLRGRRGEQQTCARNIRQ